MKYCSNSDTVTRTAPVGNVVSGQAFIQGTEFLVAISDATAGADVECVRANCKVKLASKSGDTFTAGAKVYFNATTSEIEVTDTTTNYEVGTADGASVSDYVWVILAGKPISAGGEDLDAKANKSDLASTATGATKGAKSIGIYDTPSKYTATTVEAALAEVKDLADAAAPAATTPSMAAAATAAKQVIASSAASRAQAAVAGVLATACTTTVGASVELAEGTDNGAHTLKLQGPDSLAASRTVTFPDASIDLTNLSSADEKAAQAGTSGTAPSAANKFVDNADTRMTDARTPTAHAASHATLGGDAIAPADIGAAPASTAQVLTVPAAADNLAGLSALGALTDSGVAGANVVTMVSNADAGSQLYLSAGANKVAQAVASLTGTAATTTVGASLSLSEGTDNGAHKVSVKAADSLAADAVVTLPAVTTDLGNASLMAAAGGADEFLYTTDASRNLVKSGVTKTNVNAAITALTTLPSKGSIALAVCELAAGTFAVGDHIDIGTGGALVAFTARAVPALAHEFASAGTLEDQINALIAVVNNAADNSLPVRASQPSAGTLVVEYADTAHVAGVVGIPGDIALAATVTGPLTATWSQENLNLSGAAPSILMAHGRITAGALLAAAILAGTCAIANLPFSPTAASTVQLTVRTSAGALNPVTDQVTIVGDTLFITGAGATHVAATDVIDWLVIA